MVLFFYFFAFSLILGAIMVINSNNPVYSVLWLIFTFCNASGLMLLIGAEFIAMMLIVIYVGAIAVLFLFVVMMLDIKKTELKNKLGEGAGFAKLICIFLFADLVAVIFVGTKLSTPPATNYFAISQDISNTRIIGQFLYTTFILQFQTSGLVLLSAMIGSIALTLKIRRDNKTQNPDAQLNKNKCNSLSIVKIATKQGMEEIKYDDN